MDVLTIIFAVALFGSSLWLILATLRKIRQYAQTPNPLKIALTPAPTTRSGTVWRVIGEVLLFKSLFRSSKWTWIFGWMFHVSLALVLFRHLRYFMDPVPALVAMEQPFGIYAGITMVIGLAGLWARRFLVDRVRYISTPSDHLMLVLLIGIGMSGLAMSFVFHTDIVAFKAFTLGVMTLSLSTIPADPVLLMHLTGVIVLMLIFPISKLLHAPGVFFSPTRTMIDDPREKGHVTTWARADGNENG